MKRSPHGLRALRVRRRSAGESPPPAPVPRSASALRAPLALLAAVALAACARPEARRVRIVLTLQGAAARPVHGLDLVVALPPGATVDHDASTGRLRSGALSLLPGAEGGTVDGRFASHAAAPSVRILVASRQRLRDGPVLAIDATVTSAVSPSLVRYEVASTTAAGPDGRPAAGATAWVSAVEAR